MDLSHIRASARHEIFGFEQDLVDEAIEATEWKLLRPAHHIITVTMLTHIANGTVQSMPIHALAWILPRKTDYHLTSLIALASLTLSTTDQARLLEFHHILHALP